MWATNKQTTANSAECGQYAYAHITNKSALNLKVNVNKNTDTVTRNKITYVPAKQWTASSQWGSKKYSKELSNQIKNIQLKYNKINYYIKKIYIENKQLQ